MRMNKNASLFWAWFLLVVYFISRVVSCFNIVDQCRPMTATDNQIFEFALNLEFLEAEFFLNGALGKGLDSINRSLASGGPSPVGVQKANLDPSTAKIFEEFAYQEIGQMRAVLEALNGRGIERPLLNLSKEVFAEMMDKAVGYKLKPSFNPYANSTNFLLAANLIPCTGSLGLVGVTPALLFLSSRKLAAALLPVEAGQCDVTRTLLYQRANERVAPYNITVAEFTNFTARLANQLGKCGVKDEGIMVPRSLGAENRTESNILAADKNSISYQRTANEILRIFYGTGNERKPGGFFPEGANGWIARSLRG